MRLDLAKAAAATATNGVGAEVSDYLEPIAVFLAEEDKPVSVVFPDLLPCGVIMLLHGEPRARKSLAAFELALAAATGTAPFGLARFQPAGVDRRALHPGRGPAVPHPGPAAPAGPGTLRR